MQAKRLPGRSALIAITLLVSLLRHCSLRPQHVPPRMWPVWLFRPAPTEMKAATGRSPAMEACRPLVAPRIRLDVRPEAEQAHRGYGFDPERQGLLAGCQRRRHFSFGDAVFYGSTGSISLNQPIVGHGGATPGGFGSLRADGGIFAYGRRTILGSTGSLKLNKPIVGMSPTPSNKGYWLVASDGGIFAYGDAGFFAPRDPSRSTNPSWRCHDRNGQGLLARCQRRRHLCLRRRKRSWAQRCRPRCGPLASCPTAPAATPRCGKTGPSSTDR